MLSKSRTLGCAILLLGPAAAAQDVFVRPHPVPAPAPGVVLQSVRATVRITDAAAVTEVEQVFRNFAPREVEEVYLYPLPDGAFVSDFALTIDGKPVKGELLDRDKARGIYEDIVRRRRDPALLEWMGKGCVRVSAFPVPANGEARVRLEYTSVLPTVAKAFEYRLPLSLAPVAPGGLRSLVFDATIEASGSLAAIYSPSHKVEVRRDGERRARATMEASEILPDRDLVLYVTPADGEFGFLPLFHRRSGEPGYFLALFSPRFDLEPDKIQPKDLVFVLDTSGSMSGEKMDQAKGALRQALARLRPADRFNLVRFSTEADSFRAGPVEADEENLAAARRWIGDLEARGGTNIDEGLARALAGRTEGGRLRLVLFLTDGLPTVGTTDEKEILSNVRSRNEAGTRVFVFGVGADVNTRLLDTIAEETRAAREYVRPEEDIEVKVASLLDKVSSPVLAGVTVTCAAADAFDVYPKKMPDLFKGGQLLVVGRYRGEGATAVVLTGRFGDAERRWVYDVSLPKNDEANDSVRAIWADRKVGFLLDEIRLRGSNSELIEEIRRIGREHGIVTPYTSYLVLEEGHRLADARGVRREAFRFADVNGDGALDAPSVLTGSDDFFLGHIAAGEKKSAEESEDALRRLGRDVSGEAAVGGSLEARDRAGATSAPAGPTTPGATLRVGGAPGRASRLGFSDEAQAGIAANQLFVRRVGGKTFHLVGSVWVDASFTDKDREKVTKIAFLSPEYFALLAREPGLARYLALGDRVLVSWKGVFYEIG